MEPIAMPPAADPTFDWRQHINISQEFAPEERELIAKSFDRLHQFHDGEGQQLISAAAASNWDGRIQIRPDEQSAAKGDGIALNFAQLSRGHFTNDPEGRGPSLLGTIVHELYHKADPQASLDDNEAMRVMTSVVKPDGMMVPIKEVAMQDLNWGPVFDKLTIGSQDQRNELAQDLEQNYPESAAIKRYAQEVRTVSGEEWIQRFHQAGVTDAQGIPYTEQRATQYTDTLMAKNVGDAEPQRGNYQAMSDGEVHAIDWVPDILPVPQSSSGFDGPGAVDVTAVRNPVATLSQPDSPLPALGSNFAALLAGMDLSALTQCRTDSVQYSAADTCRLTNQVATNITEASQMGGRL